MTNRRKAATTKQTTSQSSDHKQVSVLVSDKFANELPSVIEQLKRAGMSVRGVQDALGTVTGSVPATHVDAVRRVPGVESVDEDRTYTIAPPSSKVQ